MARYKVKKRERALERGMKFLYQLACDPQNFDDYGAEFLYLLKTIASTSKDDKLRKMAGQMARERFRQFKPRLKSLPRNADADTVMAYFHTASTVQMFGVRNSKLKQQLRQAAKQFTPAECLWFDPYAEPPPSDVPHDCSCGIANERGRKSCRNRRCKAELAIMTRYETWYYSLTRAYCAENYGIILGAPYADIIRWLPVLRPYPIRKKKTELEFADTVYALSHLVYTLNDYGRYQLSPRWLPQEYEFLKDNLGEAIALDDPDMMGEFLDSLMALGLTDNHPQIRKGMSFLLEKQNEDGSWGDVEAEDIYARYHPTWAAIDGLREYAWHGEGLKFPRLLPLLKDWARNGDAGWS